MLPHMHQVKDLQGDKAPILNPSPTRQIFDLLSEGRTFVCGGLIPLPSE